MQMPVMWRSLSNLGLVTTAIIGEHFGKICVDL